MDAEDVTQFPRVSGTGSFDDMVRCVRGKGGQRCGKRG